MMPGPDELRTAIAEVFTREPTRHWEPVLREIADGTEVGEVEIELGSGKEPNRTPDDDGKRAEP